ncbi:phage BR0599 family protein [Sphingomonas sp. BT553]|uniref:Phage BR0599 family protein n=2 Tax=Sphingomonas mollis TaxID=2795726 RepID=A0ABS0XRR3_9SPHN|nr:phage BR0599 family protein [Sphingomonas sp. BT553]
MVEGTSGLIALCRHGEAYEWRSGIGGANGGLDSAVAMSAGAQVTLRAPPVFAVTAGDLVELVEGCDRTLATCARRFGNAANFRGEPHLPGIDLLTRWPGG